MSSDAPHEQPLAYRVARGGLWAMLSWTWIIGFGFIANIALTRLLVQEAFGAFALSMFFVQLLRVQTKTGLSYAFTNYRGSSPEALGTYFSLEGGATLLGLALALLAVPVLRRLGYAELSLVILPVLAVSLAVESLVGAAMTLLNKELAFTQIGILQSLVFPLSYIPGFYLALNNGGVWSLVAQNMTYNLLLLVGLAWIVPRGLPHLFRARWHFSPALARRFLSFGLTIGFGLLAALLLTSYDHFLIGTFISLSALGIYERAYRIAQWPNTLLTNLTTRLAYFTYASLEADGPRLQKSAQMILWMIVYFSTPIALVVFVAAPDIIRLLYTEKWLAAAPFLRFLIVYTLVRPLIENASSLLIALGQPRRATLLNLSQTVALILAATPLTLWFLRLGEGRGDPFFGAFGAALGVGAAFLVGLIFV
jgi:O-antigen/teichoic acid export membrane protein